MTKLSVVIPVLNEETLIQELIDRVTLNCEKITNDYEVIIVDDGSLDGTWLKISEASKLNIKIKGLKFSRNFGHHYALTAGLHETIGEWVVVMDGDLQDRPEVIPDLYEESQKGYDVVFVSRKNRPEKIHYRVLQKIFYWFLKSLSGLNFDSSQANFSIINRKVVDAFKAFPENARFYGSTIMWLGFKRTKIFADHGKRLSGKPSYTLKKRLRLASDIILSFSERPLKFAIGVGVILSTISILVAIWVIYAAITWGYSVTGWTSLIFSTFFFSGVILVFLGIIGIYLGRVFQEVKRRPLYVVSERLNKL
jgi:glycosyltransferase involved in cell wall biosynthesis